VSGALASLIECWHVTGTDAEAEAEAYSFRFFQRLLRRFNVDFAFGEQRSDRHCQRAMEHESGQFMPTVPIDFGLCAAQRFDQRLLGRRQLHVEHKLCALDAQLAVAQF
jgi:hypothetical protein